MDIALGLTFLGVELVFIVLVLLVVVQTGFTRLESIVGIAGDGFPPGKAVPPWNLPDLTGQARKTPAGDRWQFLIFVDHALGGFPDLIVGMQYLVSTVEELEVVVLSRDSKEFCEAMVRGLDLQVPVVPVAPTFYARFRVRVMPFAFLLDPRGIVRWAGLVNTKALLVHLWKLSQAVRFEGNSLEEGVRG